MSTPVVPPAVAAVASDAPPKPVAPAEAIPQAPAAALDPLTHTQGGFLEKARETILPIVEKVQTTTKPYTDAAAVKAQQFVEKIEERIDGNPHATGATARDLPAGAIPPGPNPAGSTITSGLPTTSGEAAEKAKGVFEQVSSAVSSTFTQITNTIETKTTTETHPGLITQVQNAVATGQKKLDALLDQVDQPAATGQHPIQTTTNTVPHPVTAKEPKTVAVPVVPIGVAAVAPGAIGVPPAAPL